MDDQSPDLKPEPDHFLGNYLQFLLATASGLASAPFHVQALQAGMSVPEWRVMACLWDSDGQTITELARLAQMEQSRLTRVIERMEKRSHVSRERRKDDRRKVYVWLTDAGRAVAGDLVAKAKAHEIEFLSAHLTPAEGVRLKGLLKKLIENAQKDHVPVNFKA